MTKQITPMKRLSNNMSSLRENISHLFSETVLNKSSPRSGGAYNNYNYTKGVESDCIQILASNKDNGVSFAVSYSYLDKEPEAHRIEVSVKIGKDNDSIVRSVPLTIEQFKEKINFLNKDLNTLKLAGKLFDVTEAQVIEKVSTSFLDKKIDLQEEIDKATVILQEFADKTKATFNIPALSTDATLKEKELKKYEAKINKTLQESVEGKRLKELEDELAKLKSHQNQERKKLETTYNVPTLKTMVQQINAQLSAANYKFEGQLNQEMRKYPQRVVQKIKLK